MNWGAIITVIAVCTGIYFIWSFLSGKQENPTTQEAFGRPPEGLIIDSPDPYAQVITQPDIANEIPAVVPEETVTYDTIYNIVVEAPVIPKLDTALIMDDIVDDIGQIDNNPITQPTGGEDQLVRTVTPSGGTKYSTPKSIKETTPEPIYNPVEMVTDTARPVGSFGGR